MITWPGLSYPCPFSSAGLKGSAFSSSFPQPDLLLGYTLGSPLLRPIVKLCDQELQVWLLIF